MTSGRAPSTPRPSGGRNYASPRRAAATGSRPSPPAPAPPGAGGRRAARGPPRRDDEEQPPAPHALVPPLDRAPDLVWEPEEVRQVWAEEPLEHEPSLKGAAEIEAFPRGQPHAFEAQR